MSERKFKITLDEDELKAVIGYHLNNHYGSYDVERSARIHDLTKRLNKKDDEKETTEVPEQQPQTSTVSGW
jgi:hypothetical protein